MQGRIPSLNLLLLRRTMVGNRKTSNKVSLQYLGGHRPRSDPLLHFPQPFYSKGRKKSNLRSSRMALRSLSSQTTQTHRSLRYLLKERPVRNLMWQTSTFDPSSNTTSITFQSFKKKTLISLYNLYSEYSKYEKYNMVPVSWNVQFECRHSKLKLEFFRVWMSAHSQRTSPETPKTESKSQNSHILELIPPKLFSRVNNFNRKSIKSAKSKLRINEI